MGQRGDDRALGDLRAGEGLIIIWIFARTLSSVRFSDRLLLSSPVVYTVGYGLGTGLCRGRCSIPERADRE